MNKLEFFRKEIFEILKTSKKIILPAIMLFWGILSPLTAKFTNELVKSLGGINMKLPDPVYTDSYLQLFKNHYGITAIVMVFLFMGLVAAEKTKGTAILALTKNLSRTNFILSKFFASVILFTVSYLLSVGVCIYYTYFLFGTFWNDGVLLSLFMFWLFGLLIICMMIFAGVIARSTGMAALYGFLGYIFVSIVSAIPKVGEYSPYYMFDLSLKIMDHTKKATAAIAPIAVTSGLALVLLVSSIFIFRKQEL